MVKQKEFFGYNSIRKIEEILEGENVKRVFLVTGKTSFKLSGAEDSLKDILSDYYVFRFYNFEENPKIEDVEKGLKLFLEDSYDIVIAVGGGTVIDIAKLINTFSAQEGDIIDYLKGDKEIRNQGGKPLIAVPTTSGTGSEATHFSVVYVNKTKHSIAHDFMLPKYSIVDPELTFSLSPKITASTGIDALSQAIESYWCINSTDESKKYAKKAMKLVLSNLEDTVKNPTKESRSAMARAANLAGKAINITKTTAPHAISYPFTSYFNIPHGHAVGLALGKILVYNSNLSEDECTDSRGIDYVKKTINELTEMIGSKTPKDASNKIYSLMRSIGLKTKLSEIGLEKNSIGVIIQNTNEERMTNNPRTLNKEEIRKIIEEIF
ncbi:MAG: phosphonoacetaldehyde reductase [Candidatus Pacearchaeota archaeon]